jgi:hypothetical protein
MYTIIFLFYLHVIQASHSLSDIINTAVHIWCKESSQHPQRACWGQGYQNTFHFCSETSVIKAGVFYLE